MSEAFADADHPRALLQAMRLQQRVIGALILREIRTRFGTSRLGYAWAVAEPILHFMVLSWIYMALMRQPLAGMSIALFFMSGVIPYFVYDKTGHRLAGAINANRALLHLALVKHVDVIVARALLELATLIFVFALLMTGMYAFDQLQNTLIQPLILAKATALLWLIGLGVGATNAVLNALFKSWDTVFRMATRPLYLLSGMFYMAERVQSPIRDWVSYNPIIHGVELFRSGIFPGYGSTFIDETYLMAWAACSVVFGFAFERIMRRKVSTKVASG
jgi:capsular polysaccharide transport system permease protein